MFELGVKAKDKLTGFVGTIAGRVEYLTGCTQYCLTPPAKEGELKDSHWFDEARLALLPEPVVEPKTVQGERGGGPQSYPAPTK